MDGKKLLGALEKYKLPLLVLGIGLVLLLLPTGSKSSETGRERDLLLQEILSQTEGVGPVQVLISESGVVVVCRGAENARVHLEIIRAVGAYTGFGSDRIAVLKMTEPT